MTTIWQIWQNLPSESHDKGKAFEQVAKWFFQNDPHWNKILKPESIKLWHESGINWGQDNGIDLTAEGLDGSIWAIQAKAWNPNTLLTKSAVDSFFAESSRIKIDKRIIITTAKEMSKPLQQSINGQEKPVFIIKGIDLIRSLVDWSDCPFLTNPIVSQIKNDKAQAVGTWLDFKFAWLTVMVSAALIFFIITIVSGDADDSGKKPNMKVASSPPQESVEKIPTLTKRELIDGYTKFNEKFAYKWIQELPEDTFYNGTSNGIESRVSVAYLDFFACSPTLPDGVTNSIQVSARATTANDSSVNVQGWVDIMNDDSGLYEVRLNYLNKISRDSLKLINKVIITNIQCRM